MTNCNDRRCASHRGGGGEGGSHSTSPPRGRGGGAPDQHCCAVQCSAVLQQCCPGQGNPGHCTMPCTMRDSATIRTSCHTACCVHMITTKRHSLLAQWRRHSTPENECAGQCSRDSARASAKNSHTVHCSAVHLRCCIGQHCAAPCCAMSCTIVMYCHATKPKQSHWDETNGCRARTSSSCAPSTAKVSTTSEATVLLADSDEDTLPQPPQRRHSSCNRHTLSHQYTLLQPFNTGQPQR